MHLNEQELQNGLPISGMECEHDVVLKLEEFDGDMYDDLVQAIIKKSEASRSIGSFASYDFATVVRLQTHGFRGIKCYEGVAKDIKGRTWFLKIIDEYRAYDIGMEADDLLKQFIDKYIKREPT